MWIFIIFLVAGAKTFTTDPRCLAFFVSREQRSFVSLQISQNVLTPSAWHGTIRRRRVARAARTTSSLILVLREPTAVPTHHMSFSMPDAQHPKEPRVSNCVRVPSPQHRSTRLQGAILGTSRLWLHRSDSGLVLRPSCASDTHCAGGTHFLPMSWM